MRRLLHQLGRPLTVVVALVLVGTVLVATQLLSGDPTYHARLRQAAGLEPGNDVRIAGLGVGRVTAVEADRDEVDVTFTLSADPERVALTEDTEVEVKLLSLLGERYLALRPGSADPLADGETIAVAHAQDSYTMEEFWLESIPVVQDLDLDTIEQAVDVLATDLAIDPQEMRRALDGVSDLAGVVESREQQLDRLLESTEQVTGLVLDQTARIDEVLHNGRAVMAMLDERRESLRQLLDAGHDFVTGLTALVRQNAPQLTPLLRDLRAVLKTFEQHHAELERTFELAGPTMRVFTNATGDGPWLGVNAPYAIFPDDLVCTVVAVRECS